MAVTVVSAWMVASQRTWKRNEGFWLFLLSNILWVIWGLHDRAYALIFLQLCLAGLNVRGVYKNRQPPSHSGSRLHFSLMNFPRSIPSSSVDPHESPKPKSRQMKGHSKMRRACSVKLHHVSSCESRTNLGTSHVATKPQRFVSDRFVSS
jgi:hypothetical protein